MNIAMFDMAKFDTAKHTACLLREGRAGRP